MRKIKYKKINKSKCHCTTLRRANNALTAYYDAAFQEIGISISQFSLLRNLERLGEASTTEFAEYVNLERSTLVRNLKPLQEKGYVVDLAKKGERNHRFIVGKAGEDILQKGGPIWNRVQGEIKEYLGKENVEQFMELLYKLQELSAL